MIVTDSHVVDLPGITFTVLSFNETPPLLKGNSILIDGVEYERALVMDMSPEKAAVKGGHDLTGAEATFMR